MVLVAVEVDPGELPLAPRQPREARGCNYGQGGGGESSPALTERRKTPRTSTGRSI